MEPFFHYSQNGPVVGQRYNVMTLLFFMQPSLITTCVCQAGQRIAHPYKSNKLQSCVGHWA